MGIKRGRPKRWQSGYRITTWMIPKEYEVFIQEAELQSCSEGRSLSTLILDLAVEGWKLHYPGNSQTKIGSFTGELPLPLKLKLKYGFQALHELLGEFRKLKQKDGAYAFELKEKIQRKMIELSELNLFGKNEEVAELVGVAEKTLEEKNKK